MKLNKEITFNEKGSYLFECTSGYDWPDYDIVMYQSILDLDADIILSVSDSA